MGLEWVPDELIKNIELEREMNPGHTAEDETRHELRNKALLAAKSMTYLAAYGESESTRFNASRYVLDRVLGKPGFDLDKSDLLNTFLNDVAEYVGEN